MVTGLDPQANSSGKHVNYTIESYRRFSYQIAGQTTEAKATSQLNAAVV
jgi:hypothetical protein